MCNLHDHMPPYSSDGDGVGCLHNLGKALSVHVWNITTKSMTQGGFKFPDVVQTKESMPELEGYYSEYSYLDKFIFENLQQSMSYGAIYLCKFIFETL